MVVTNSFLTCLMFRNESKQPGQRPRQKTMVVQSQLSLEIENAFKEAKEVGFCERNLFGSSLIYFSAEIFFFC